MAAEFIVNIACNKTNFNLVGWLNAKYVYSF